MTPILAPMAAAAAAVALAGLAAALWLRHRAGARRHAMSQLLDAADELEARLRAARAEIEASAGGSGDPIREAMQEMLRQRLWLQQHGGQASLDQLRSVRESIDAARQRIDQQLWRIERARASLH